MELASASEAHIGLRPPVVDHATQTIKERPGDGT